MYDCFVNVVTCAPHNLRSGQIDYNTSALANGGHPVGTTASFTCFSTFNLVGPEATTCSADGNWDQRSPVCASIGNRINLLLLYYSQFIFYLH